jgi:hypothetical protein
MADRSLRVGLDEVRGKTVRLLQGVSDTDARWSPAGLHNHILWHAGHCFVLVEHLTMEAVAGQPHVPDGWFDIFSWTSNPANVHAEDWPTLARVTDELKRQHARLRHMIDGFSEERLESASAKHPNRTVRYAILHGLHDEATHAGEIWLLRKMRAS